MRSFFLLLLLCGPAGWLCGPGAAAAEELPAGGRDLLPSPELKVYAGRAAAGQGASADTVPVSGREFPTAQRLILPQHPARPWDAGARSQLAGGVEEGDTGVVVFEARALPLAGQKPEEAEAGGAVYLEEPVPPNYAKAAELSFRCGPEWRKFHLSYQATRALPAGKGALVFHLALKAQALELGPVRLIHYGKSVPLEDLPRTAVTYKGRAADAPWRQAALDRIAGIRTAPLRVRVVDAAGQPVGGAEVRVRQRRSAFGFGSAVTAAWLTAEGEDGRQYRRIVDECFSRVVFENDLKMEFWEQSLENRADSGFQWRNTDRACAWLKERGIGIRGHYLVWAPWEDWSTLLKAEPDKIKARVLAHIPRVASETGDRVMEWDAINHLAGWDKNIDEATGVDFYTEIMKACRAATGLPLWVNEDQVFRPGRQQEDYYTRIRGLIEDGAKPDGIGNQAHFDESFLPGPQEMLASSDRFAALVPALQITEFDVTVNNDEQLEADYLRDTLIMAYSHPAYTGFLTWGFWEGAHWKPQAALWRKDWSEKPSAKVWREWVNDRWATRAATRTGPDGTATIEAAHLGTYEIVAEAGGKTLPALSTVLTRDSAPVEIRLQP